MERAHLRSVGVNDFVRWNEERALVLSPKFQRRRVWPQKAKAFLIDTILRGLPIPKLYMRQHLDLRTSKTLHEVVDGQQRLGAVLEFRAGKIRLPKDDAAAYGGLLFEELPKEGQRAFLTYEFSVDLLIDAADADVLDIFARINSYAVPLNAQEKRNAKYFGSFKRTVYSLGFEHLEFWKKHRILSDSAIARMREAELTSEIVVAMTSGLQDKKSSLDRCYAKWDDRFPYKQKCVNRFRDVIDLIERYLGQGLAQSHFKRSVLFYSVFMALYELRYESLDCAGAKQTFGEREGARLQRAIATLDDALDTDSPSAEFVAFVTACQQQTDNVGPRRARHNQILAEFRRA